MHELCWGLGLLLMCVIITCCFYFPKKKSTTRLSFKRSVFYMCVLALIASGLYLFFGSMSGLRHYWHQKLEHQQAEAILKKLPSKAVVVDRLEALLKRDPNRPKGWALLGRIRLSQGRAKDAVTAYQKAWHLMPTNSDYAIGLSESLLLANQPLPADLLTQCESLLHSTKDSAQKAALLNLLAIHAYRTKQYKKAVGYWERVLPYYPVGSQDEQQLLRMIHKAQAEIS